MGRYVKSRAQILALNRDYIARCVALLCSNRNITPEQRKEIRAGLEAGLSYRNVEKYARPDFPPNVMYIIRRQLIAGQSFPDALQYANKVYHKKIFNLEAKTEIQKGTPHSSSKEKSSADYKNSAKGKQIESGLKNKKVAKGEKLFSNPALSSNQIIQIQVGLENGLSLEQVGFYAHRKFTGKQMAQIRVGFEEGLPLDAIAIYAKTKFTYLQMIEIRKGFENGLPIEAVKEYAIADFTTEEMYSIRLDLENTICAESETTDTDEHHATQHMTSTVESQIEIQNNDEKNTHCKSKEETIKSYFSEDLIKGIKLQYENLWNAWLQSKQVFLYDDAFAADVLANAIAVDEIAGEVFLHCPYTSSYIIAKDTDGTYLEFFAILSSDMLQLCLVQAGSVQNDYVLHIYPERNGRDLLSNISEGIDRENVRKMLQLYVCLCAADLEDAAIPNDRINHNPIDSANQARHANNVVTPTCDIDIYTVTIRHDTKNQYHRSSSNRNSNAPLRRAHKRRAHWHHYWVGSKSAENARHLVLKWVPEVNVNPTGNELPIRIILVRNNP